VLAEDQEARGVVRLVLDVLGQLGQAVARRRSFAGDRRGTRLGAAFWAASALLPTDTRWACGRMRSAIVALRQRLGVRIDLGDASELGLVGHQF
jgi:membrane-bound lytic murein transglycosylase